MVTQFLAQQKVTVVDHPLHLPDLAPADYFLFQKVKSHSISDMQTAVTSTLNTIAKDDFYNGIQKLYDRANVCTVTRDLCRKLNNKSVISPTQILFLMPVIKLSGRTVYASIFQGCTPHVKHELIASNPISCTC